MSVGPLLLSTLRNYNGDDNGNFKKSHKFNEQNNNSARASCFFVNFFAVLARLWQWHCQILSQLPENGNGKAINSIASDWTLARVPSLQFLSFLFNMAIWDNFLTVSKDKKSIFLRRLHGRRRCQVVRSLLFSYRKAIKRNLRSKDTGFDACYRPFSFSTDFNRFFFSGLTTT